MEDKGNNPVGSGDTRPFRPAVHRPGLGADDLGQALAKVRDL